jgi:citrate lyase alpha subunit
MIRCALCGFEYEPVPSCPASCPLNGACHFVCCPRCGYQNIDASQSAAVKLVTEKSAVISNAVSNLVSRIEISRIRSK